MDTDNRNNNLLNEFNKFYKNAMAFYVDVLEKERIRTWCHIIGNLILTILTFIILFYIIYKYESAIAKGLFLATFIFSSVHITFLAKEYKEKIKKEVLQQLLSFVGDFKHEKNSFSKDYLRSLKLLPKYSFCDINDKITGIYKLLRVDIAEISLYAGKNNKIFRGLLIIIPCKKVNKGYTVIHNKRKNYTLDSTNFWLKERNLPKKAEENIQIVNIENSEFNEYYEVISNDKAEAGYLITTSFINKITDLAKSKLEGTISVSFENGNVNIVVYNLNKDWFDISLFKPANNVNSYRAIIYEILQIMKIIDSLRLEQEIGF